MTELEIQIVEALSRGYTHDANAHKEIDFDLLKAQVEEITKAFDNHVGENPEHINDFIRGFSK